VYKFMGGFKPDLPDVVKRPKLKEAREGPAQGPQGPNSSLRPQFSAAFTQSWLEEDLYNHEDSERVGFNEEDEPEAPEAEEEEEEEAEEPEEEADQVAALDLLFSEIHPGRVSKPVVPSPPEPVHKEEKSLKDWFAGPSASDPGSLSMSFLPIYRNLQPKPSVSAAPLMPPPMSEIMEKLRRAPEIPVPRTWVSRAARYTSVPVLETSVRAGRFTKVMGRVSEPVLEQGTFKRLRRVLAKCPDGSILVQVTVLVRSLLSSCAPCCDCH
jgi:hypothetical protein